MRPRHLLSALLIMVPSLAGAGNLTLSPASLDFGEVQVGQAAVRTTRVTNHGSPTTITGFTPGVSCSEFLASAPLPITLADRETLLVTVTYQPSTRGPVLCALRLEDDNGVSNFLGATGVGMASRLVVYDTFIPFTTQTWDSAVPETLHILCENQGNLPIGPGNFSAQFSLGTDFRLGDVSFPIPPGGLGGIPLIFHPASLGPKSDFITFSVNNDIATDPSPELEVYGAWHSQTSVSDPPASAGEFRIGPSPTRGEVRIRYSAPRPGRVEIAIRDVAGRTVVNHSQFAGGPGPQSAALAGPADWSPSPGVYLVSVTLDGEVLGRGRIVVVR